MAGKTPEPLAKTPAMAQTLCSVMTLRQNMYVNCPLSSGLINRLILWKFPVNGRCSVFARSTNFFSRNPAYSAGHTSIVLGARIPMVAVQRYSGTRYGVVWEAMKTRFGFDQICGGFPKNPCIIRCHLRLDQYEHLKTAKAITN